MRFTEMFQTGRKLFSLEFFPPRREDGLDSVVALIKELGELRPDFMTVTTGAEHSRRMHTRELVSFIQHQLQICAVAHFTSVGLCKQEIDETLEGLRQKGIYNVLALRGDPLPEGSAGGGAEDAFTNARDLTKYLSQQKQLSIAVAGYPEGHRDAASLSADLLYLKEKVDAGAELVITQLFFEPERYFKFCRLARELGITVPILPGIMPIDDIRKAQRFADKCGATIPEFMWEQYGAVGSDAAKMREYGISEATELCTELLAGGAPGIHFYTLNKSDQVRSIVEKLRKRGHLPAASTGQGTLS